MKVFVIFFFTISISKNSMAWGSHGHRLVAEIAFKLLDTKTKTNVISALGGYSIENAATWMDDQRSNSAFDEMKPWHYIEFKEGEPPSSAKFPNIAIKLSESVELLKNKKNLSAFQVQQALLYIFHLIGDISQPLHCAYKTDAGGNAEKVVCYGLKNITNLHHVWDDEIIEKNKITLESCSSAMSSFNKNNLLDFVYFDPYGWVTDSRVLLPIVYDFQNSTITQAYLFKNKTAVEIQLDKAALRLAYILNTYFKSNK